MNVSEITSRKNQAVLDAAALSTDKKYRDRYGLFPAEGAKLLYEALDAGLCVKSVFFTHAASERYGDLLSRVQNAALYRVTDEVFAKLSTESAPQGIYACLEEPPFGVLSDEEIAHGGFVILDALQNPSNIGAVLRSAYALGAARVLISPGCADLYAPKTVRAAMGSLFRITPYFTEDLPETLRRFASVGIRVFCTRLDKNSRQLGTVAFRESDCFVVGNEGHGVSPAVADACPHCLYIPMQPGAESLNAAAAAALVMWEMKKNTLLTPTTSDPESR